MRKAVNLWKTSEYWERRASGAIHHAKYKERPDVRARRIKKIEAEKRKRERELKNAETFLSLWDRVTLTREKASAIANYDHVSQCFPLDKYPRPAESSQYEGYRSLWSALQENIIDAEQARAMAIECKQNIIAYCQRWIEHLKNRLTYEKAMLADQGASDLLKPKPKPKALPLCNYRAPDGIEIENIYYKDEFTNCPQVEMTKAEYARIHTDYKSTRPVGNSHRVRTAMIKTSLCCVFLTDSKTHTIPAPMEKTSDPKRVIPRQTHQPKEPNEFDKMAETLTQGVEVVTADQLFETPRELAERMVELAEIQKGNTVLEPSAGTGRILHAIMGNDKAGEVVAVEINPTLADRLKTVFLLTDIHCLDFLTYDREKWPVDRIIMNPPFKNGMDIQHIQHAIKQLKPGGRLVAICANGPRQQATLKPIAAHWEDLPQGTFKQQGTSVNAALMVYQA